MTGETTGSGTFRGRPRPLFTGGRTLSPEFAAEGADAAPVADVPVAFVFLARAGAFLLGVACATGAGAG